MWVISCQDGDQEAGWIAMRLRSLGLEPLELVSASQLAHGASWAHRVGGGGTTTTLRLADGRSIESTAVDGVLNRLLWVGAEGFLGASEEDRAYATAELQALVLSWLASLGRRVLNPPLAPGIAPAWRHPCEWRSDARAAGIPIQSYDSDQRREARTLLVIDREPIGAPPPGINVAALARTTVLDVFEARFGDGLLDIDPIPAFSTAPSGTAATLARALRARSEAHP